MKIKLIITVAIAALNITASAQTQDIPVLRFLEQGQRLPPPPRFPEKLSPPAGEINAQQHEEIRKIRAEQMKERIYTDNLLKEQYAELELLQTADNQNIKKINKQIDEIATTHAQRMKSSAASRQKIRSLLTEEQRIYYDAESVKRSNTRSRSIIRNDD